MATHRVMLKDSQLGCLNKRRKASYINHDAKLPTQLANSVARDSSSTLMPNIGLDVQKHKDQAGQKVATGSNKITCRIRFVIRAKKPKISRQRRAGFEHPTSVPIMHAQCGTEALSPGANLDKGCWQA